MDIGGFTHRVNAEFFIKHSLLVLTIGSTAEIKFIGHTGASGSWRFTVLSGQKRD